MSYRARKFDPDPTSGPFQAEFTNPVDSDDDGGPGTTHAYDAERHELDELEALVVKARHGDETALPRLRELLDNHPGVLGQFGDLAAHAEAAWISVIAGSDLALAEAIQRQIAALKSELGGPSPTPVERAFLAAIVTTRLHYYWAEMVAGKLALSNTTTIAESVHAQNIVSGALRRYVLATSALTNYRRFMPTARWADAVVLSATGDRIQTPTAATPGAAHHADPRNDPHNAPVEPVTLGVFEPEVTSAGCGSKARRKRTPQPAS